MGGDGEAMGGRTFILQNFQGIKKIENISLLLYNFFGWQDFHFAKFSGCNED